MQSQERLQLYKKLKEMVYTEDPNLQNDMAFLCCFLDDLQDEGQFYGVCLECLPEIKFLTHSSLYQKHDVFPYKHYTSFSCGKLMFPSNKNRVIFLNQCIHLNSLKRRDWRKKDLPTTL